MRLYAIRHVPSGEILTTSIRSNGDADFCNDTTVELKRTFGSEFDQPHLFTKRDYAVRALSEYVDWYNSDMVHPMMNKNLRCECEVVAVDITINPI